MKKTILVIEDEDYVLEMIVFALEQEGYDVKTATNGKEGLALLRKKAVDLIICDIMMPVMDGYAFADTLKADPELMRIPIIFLSAKTSEEDQIAGRLRGADDYITKPFDTGLLLGVIAARLKWVDKYRALSNALLDDIRGRLLSLLSDEFRNPLMSISGATESLREHLSDFGNDITWKFLDIISEQTKKLGFLVDDFLSFTEFELFHNKLEKDGKLLETIDQCITVNKTTIAEKTLSVQSFLPTKEIQINLPQSTLLRILDRVLNRIIASAFEEEILSIGVKEFDIKRKKVEIGLLISKNRLNEKKFMTQISKATKQVNMLGEPGAEVGLFVVERILEKCGSKIHVQQPLDRLTGIRIEFVTNSTV